MKRLSYLKVEFGLNTVTAPLESRIQRVIERDKTTRDQILGRITWTDEQRVLKVIMLL
jgi:dephospho-CoA kinase